MDNELARFLEQVENKSVKLSERKGSSFERRNKYIYIPSKFPLELIAAIVPSEAYCKLLPTHLKKKKRKKRNILKPIKSNPQKSISSPGVDGRCLFSRELIRPAF